MPGTTITGTGGEIRKGYQVVVELGAWAIDPGGLMTAHPVSINRFWLEQGGEFCVSIPFGRKSYEWDAATVVQPDDVPMTVRLDGTPVLRG